MINFKQIELSDQDEVDCYLSGNTYQACDFCFTNLYTWQAQFKAAYAIVEETIFLRFRDSDGDPYYMMPIGEMPLPEAFDLIEQDAKKNNVPFQMKKITTDMWQEIDEAMPNHFEYTSDRNNDEYIYTSEKLIKLSGKKLQSKRNHINRFQREYPDWQYHRIETADDVADCKAMLSDWQKMYAADAGRGIEFDFIATNVMLDEFDHLPLRGGYITIEGRVVAFTLGSQIDQDTFGVHVEKAYSDILGGYTMINQQFAEHEMTNFQYVNREEDLGIENLRKAKLSYYPDILLHEGIIRVKA